MVTFVLVPGLLIAVLVLGGFVMSYNEVGACDINTDEAIGGIDGQLARHAALILRLISTTLDKLTTTIPWMFIAGMAGGKQREFYQVPK